MKVLSSVSLASYTTIKIGGMVECLWFPETVMDLEDILKQCKDVRILGGGSNLLINDEEIYKNVICLKQFNRFLQWEGDCVEVGSGISLHKLIEEINAHGYGGIEYLYSVPGLLGGAIAMNAGRGAAYNMSIADYLVSVKVMQQGKIVTLSKEECNFSYRNSRFKNGDEIIISAVFAFEKMDKGKADEKRRARMNFVKENQDMSFPNLGTTFCKANSSIMGFVKRISLKRRGICFSSKTSNWLQNRGNGSFKDAMFCIKVVERLHKLFRKECRVAYVIWR